MAKRRAGARRLRADNAALDSAWRQAREALSWLKYNPDEDDLTLCVYPKKEHVEKILALEPPDALKPVREALNLCKATFESKCEGQHKWPKEEINEALKLLGES